MDICTYMFMNVDLLSHTQGTILYIYIYNKQAKHEKKGTSDEIKCFHQRVKSETRVEHNDMK